MFEQLGINLAQFHFIRPYALLGLLPLAVLAVLLIRRRLRGGRWEAVCDPALIPHVVVPGGAPRRRWPLWALCAAGTLGILALAGPTWERLPVPVFRNESALIIVLDLSRSMNAGDIVPSRLVRARYKVEDILQRRTEGQTGLVVFAEQAFSVTPLTTDARTIISQLSALNTDLMPVQGSRADRGLRKAAQLLEHAGAAHGDVLLITDSVDAAEQRRLDELLNHYPYRLSVLGVGTAQGAPIPMPAGGFVQDSHGAIVISKLDAGALRALARRGGGIYVHLQPGNADVEALSAEFKPSRLVAPVKRTTLKADTWREEGPWLLLLVLPLAALAFRRGVLSVLCLAVLLPLARPAHAYSWSNLWLRPDQQASRAFARGDNARAAELFHNPRWKAAAEYRAGAFSKAVQDLKHPQSADDWYNRGNALARLGRLQQALQAYNEALKLDPRHADARYNRRLVEKQLHQQPPQDSDQGGKTGGQSAQKPGGANPRSAEQSNGERGKRGEDQAGRNASPREQGRNDETRRNKAGQNGKESERAGAGERKQTPAQRGEDERGRRQRGAPPEDAQLADSTPEKESKQADEQWLRRIPDDPGGLLRRKFLYQYRKEIEGDSEKDNDQPW